MRSVLGAGRHGAGGLGTAWSRRVRLSEPVEPRRRARHSGVSLVASLCFIAFDLSSGTLLHLFYLIRLQFSIWTLLCVVADFLPCILVVSCVSPNGMAAYSDYSNNGIALIDWYRPPRTNLVGHQTLVWMAPGRYALTGLL